jgi:hypothetical protein
VRSAVLDAARETLSINAAPDPTDGDEIEFQARRIADNAAKRLGDPTTAKALSEETRKVIQTIIDHKDRTGAWLEATALRTLLQFVGVDQSTAAEPPRLPPAPSAK